jgi:hypothetical protein
VKRYFLGLWLVCVTLTSSAHAQVPSTTDDAPRISLVTFGPGPEVHQAFGHNALIVSGGGYSSPAVYNYGMFGFGPGMIPKFLRGRLEFWVGVLPLARTFDAYSSADRDIRLIPLQLTVAQRLRVAAELKRDASPEHRDYLYNHYDNNCATRVRDVIDHAFDGQLKRALSSPGRFTLREHTRRYMQHDVLVDWLMMFGLNDSVDQPLTQWDEAFLPDELERALMSLPPLGAKGQEAKILGERAMVYASSRPGPPEAPVTRWPWLLLIGLINSALVIWTGLRAVRVNSARTRWAFAFVHGQLSFVVGFLGTLLLSLWFTDHLVSHGNENLWLANPLPLCASMLTFGLITQHTRIETLLRTCWSTMAMTTVGLLLLKPLLPALDQDLSMTATLFAPINIAFALTFHLRARRTAAGS